jgi:GH18 family chitinase
MASSKENRGALTASLLKFLDKWNFAGVDIDWEWPGADNRGGDPSIDKQNYASLMTELRTALGKRGLAVALPAQDEYLKQFELKALEAQIDWFNVLTYDLHGVSLDSRSWYMYVLLLTCCSLGTPQSRNRTPT